MPGMLQQTLSKVRSGLLGWFKGLRPRELRLRLELLEDRAVPSAASFFQDFASGPNVPPAGFDYGGAVGSASYTNNALVITNPTGVAQTANYVGVAQKALETQGGSAFTTYDLCAPTNDSQAGYVGAWPSQGYTTSVDIYLDVTPGHADSAPIGATDVRFDYSSAISTAASGCTVPNFDRDFAYNAGFYNSTDTTDPGIGNRFVISASTNTGRASTYPSNPQNNPIVISASGWYTFTNVYKDDGTGHLEVDMSITTESANSSSAGVVVGSWKIVTTDVVNSKEAKSPVTVGGSYYGWFVNNEFPALYFDNVTKVTPGQTGNGGLGDCECENMWLQSCNGGKSNGSCDWSFACNRGPQCHGSNNHDAGCAATFNTCFSSWNAPSQQSNCPGNDLLNSIFSNFNDFDNCHF